MDPSIPKSFYRKPSVVQHYAAAANAVGLWLSEEKVFSRVFSQEAPLLELGCGAGRIAIALWQRGYRLITAIDYSREMIEEAKRINQLLHYGIDFRYGDATELKFSDASFAGAVFGFNGLMQIPKRVRRQQALCEVARVLRDGAHFVFTTHDRASPKNRKYWQEEQKRWDAGLQQHELDEFGDIYRETEWGPMFIHSPNLQDVRDDLKQAGFVIEAEMPRSTLANEPPRVREFADECRFWITRRVSR